MLSASSPSPDALSLTWSHLWWCFPRRFYVRHWVSISNISMLLLSNLSFLAEFSRVAGLFFCTGNFLVLLANVPLWAADFHLLVCALFQITGCLKHNFESFAWYFTCFHISELSEGARSSRGVMWPFHVSCGLELWFAHLLVETFRLDLGSNVLVEQPLSKAQLPRTTWWGGNRPLQRHLHQPAHDTGTNQSELPPSSVSTELKIAKLEGVLRTELFTDSVEW